MYEIHISLLRDFANCFQVYLNLKYEIPWLIRHQTSVTSKKSPNVYKSCPKMISLEKLKILTPLEKLPNNVGDLGKLIVA